MAKASSQNKQRDDLHEALQKNFLARVGSIVPVLGLLDSFPNSFFFIKDTESRIIWVSRAKRERIGVRENESIVGKTDYDFFPKFVADSFVQDDKQVFRTRLPIVGRVEVWFTGLHQLDWSVTTKFPLFDGKGQVVGLIGFVENSSTRAVFVPGSKLGNVMSFIQANLKKNIGVEEIARAAHLSDRQLLRVFQQNFGMSVQDFLLKARIQLASEALLKDHLTITAIASDFGFCDQSAFTRQFRQQTGITPAAFRKKYVRNT